VKEHTMNPSSFKHANRLLGAPKGHVPEESEIGEIMALPVWTDGQQCVSMWRATWRERISLLLFGTLWINVWSGRTQPPICPIICRTYLRETPPADKWLKTFKRDVRWGMLLRRWSEIIQVTVGRAFQWYFHE
jgi:hypothetical protein